MQFLKTKNFQRSEEDKDPDNKEMEEEILEIEIIELALEIDFVPEKE